VLEGIGLVEKSIKNKIKWNGCGGMKSPAKKEEDRAKPNTEEERHQIEQEKIKIEWLR
jgi:hypothetical protein